MRLIRRAATSAAGIALATGAVIGAAGTAQAAGMSMGTPAMQPTVDCPCTWSDTIDGTYFEYDAGGRGGRAFLYKNGALTGKVEFHPYGEKIWLYDIKSDGDTFYVKATWYVNVGDDVYKPRSTPLYGPENGGGPTIDASWDEGTAVTVSVYDNSDGTGLIGSFTGVA
ncbi:hypothetical protein SRB5_02830 [Streptomyces sp. RB5]|uniref:Secreted protein n=1 Tax=Streptomyces smaragdinus TaxID=2585196 RepID=A0A7K0C9W2_9ACTN|nr:hypothetical protein [Streptomyces smaragdinus]MQY10176.1 hypothetical protein [Streptomyces smaragdinus]